MNLNGDYATIFNNLLLGETPPVEVSFSWCLCAPPLFRTIVTDGEISAEHSICVFLARALFSGDQTAVLVHILVLL